jgi:hypothetical protein
MMKEEKAVPVVNLKLGHAGFAMNIVVIGKLRLNTSII